MREVDDYIISVLVTLSVVMGGYLIARQMHISGPLTMVAQDYSWEILTEISNEIYTRTI
jgi:NhaP-type Na+/H+ or K+/H+ antiporter